MASKLTLSTLLLFALHGVNTVAQLNPSCAPGGNFNLTYWDLQLPIGSTDDPDTISTSSLQGCSGYQNSSMFYTDSSDGSLVMKVCGSPSSCGCVTTSGSEHCRTELRELVPSSGAEAGWSPLNATNRLAATLSVPQPDDSTYGTVIGQVHCVESVSSKPVCELYYNQYGTLTMGVEQTLSGGDEVYTGLGNIPVGDQFSYEIVYEGGVLSVSINGGAAQVLSTYSLDNPDSYFKAGNYNQGSAASEVHFYAINVDHGDGWTSIAPPSSTAVSSSTATSSATSTASTTTTSTGSTTSSSTSSSTGSSTSSAAGSAQTEYGQCGGVSWSGPFTCESPYTCQYKNAYYSQCVAA